MYEKPRLEERPLAPIHLRHFSATSARRHFEEEALHTTTTWCVLHTAKRSVLHTWKWCFTTGQL